MVTFDRVRERSPSRRPSTRAASAKGGAPRAGAITPRSGKRFGGRGARAEGARGSKYWPEWSGGACRRGAGRGARASPGCAAPRGARSARGAAWGGCRRGPEWRRSGGRWALAARTARAPVHPLAAAARSLGVSANAPFYCAAVRERGGARCARVHYCGRRSIVSFGVGRLFFETFF